MPENQPISPPQHFLEGEGVLEDLIRQGRVPMGFVKATTYPAGRRGVYQKGLEKELVFCFVPPKGTELGDCVDGGASFGYEIISPRGESKGMCKMYTMSPDQAERIIERINKHLQEQTTS